MNLNGSTITITPNDPTDSITLTPNNTTVTATSNTTTLTIASSIPSFGAVQADAVSLGTMTGTLESITNVESALQVLADNFFQQDGTPTGANLNEGDLWYDTDDNQLKVYRETSPGTVEFVPLAEATGTMDILDAGSF